MKYPKLNLENINHLHISITNNEIKAAIKIKKINVQELTDFLLNYTTEELIQILLKLFHELERERVLRKSLYEASIILIPKPDKNTTKKENYRSISLMNTGAKIFNKIDGKPNPTAYQKNHSP
jgi:uncharacterized Fe-S cluster-containing protein